MSATITPAIPQRFPESWTESKRDLRSPRGSREVWLSSRVMPRQYRPGLVYDVTGPSGEGELLTVHVGSGMLPLRILGGNVAVILGSSWGNVAEVSAAARATTTVSVWPGCKAHVYGADPERVTPSERTFCSELSRYGI